MSLLPKNCERRREAVYLALGDGAARPANRGAAQYFRCSWPSGRLIGFPLSGRSIHPVDPQVTFR